MCISFLVSQTKTNHEFSSSTKITSNGIFKDTVDYVFDVTGFQHIEKQIAGAYIGSAMIVEDQIVTDIFLSNFDLVWGGNFGKFYIGAGYNGNVFSQMSRKGTTIITQNNYDPLTGSWLGSSTTTNKDTPNSSANQGFMNNMAVIFGYKNMGFKLSFDSTVDAEAKRGSLIALAGSGNDPSLWLGTAQEVILKGNAASGVFTKITPDKKGFTNGIPYDPVTGLGGGLIFKPHFDFGMNLGFGIDLYTTAHLGFNIANLDHYYGLLTEDWTALIPYPTPTTVTNVQNYRYDTMLDFIFGAKAGAKFGSIEAALSYDFGIQTNIAKKFSDYSTPFQTYSKSHIVDNLLDTNTATEIYGSLTPIVTAPNPPDPAAFELAAIEGSGARRFIVKNRIEPTAKVVYPIGDFVKFGAKLFLPLSIENAHGYVYIWDPVTLKNVRMPAQSAGIIQIVKTVNNYADQTLAPFLKQTITSETGVTNESVIVTFEPRIAAGMQFTAIKNRLHINFGATVHLPKYESITQKQTDKGSKVITVTEYVNGTTTQTEFIDLLTPGGRTEYETTKGEWKFIGYSALQSISVGLTWFVTDSLTFDINMSNIDKIKEITELPLQFFSLTFSYKF